MRAARKAASLSQARLAELSGIPQSSISLIEGGRTVPRKETLDRLLRAARGSHGEALARHRDALLSIAERHRLSNVRIFGSVARGTAGPDSDIDLLVHGPHATLLDLAAAAAEMEERVGWAVDLVVDDDLSSRAGQHIERTAVPL